MLEKILIPVDGSPRAEAILGPLDRLLRRQETHFVFVQVLETVPGAYAGVDYATLLERDRQAAKAYFNDLGQRLSARDVRFTAHVREGMPAAAILQAVREEKPTLIAMTTHGRTGLARWTFGSVAESVVRGADVPVLLLRSHATGGGSWSPPAPEEQPFKRILFPVDGSDASLAALKATADVAKAFDAEVSVLHVVPPNPQVVVGGLAALPAPPPDYAAKTTAPAVARLADLGVKARAISAVGDAAERILEASSGADLLAIATHGRSGLARLGFGSVTERVLRHATIPMLVVRAPG